MSANLVIDLQSTTDYQTSITIGSGSDTTIGRVVDMLGANTYCNVFVAGGVAGGSGQVQIQIQTAETTASGDFTDPTSGLVAGEFPVGVVSGGNVWANSGLWNSGYSSITAPVNSAPQFCSGGIHFAAFQRPNRYARLINVSGTYPGAITAGFVSNKKVTGSGGGFSPNPSSGTVSV